MTGTVTLGCLTGSSRVSVCDSVDLADALPSEGPLSVLNFTSDASCRSCA